MNLSTPRVPYPKRQSQACGTSSGSALHTSVSGDPVRGPMPSGKFSSLCAQIADRGLQTRAQEMGLLGTWNGVFGLRAPQTVRDVATSTIQDRGWSAKVTAANWTSSQLLVGRWEVQRRPGLLPRSSLSLPGAAPTGPSNEISWAVSQADRTHGSPQFHVQHYRVP